MNRDQAFDVRLDLCFHALTLGNLHALEPPVVVSPDSQLAFKVSMQLNMFSVRLFAESGVACTHHLMLDRSLCAWPSDENG